MNLAIEYLLRNKRSHKLLSVPCSLFLTNNEGNKLVVTMHNIYGHSNNLMVKHWKTWLTKPEDKLPPFDEFRVPKNDLFSSKCVIVDNCNIMDYAEYPFHTGSKQFADMPQSHIQEQEYTNCMNGYCNTEIHKNNRQNWLWQVFESIYVPEDLRVKYGEEITTGIQLQKEIVQFYSKPIWYTWQYWKKNLLDFQTTAATELIFRRDYVKQEKPAQERTVKNYTFSFQPWTATSTTPYVNSSYYVSSEF